MELQVRIKGLPKAMALRQYTGEAMRGALARFAPLIKAVNVQLSDINGPDRGGVDKLCRIAIELKTHSFLVIEELAGEMLRAVDRAASRLPLTLSRATGLPALAG